MVDALASDASVRKDVGVRVPPWAPKLNKLTKALNTQFMRYNSVNLLNRFFK